MTMPQSASANEVAKSFGRFSRQALSAPLTITHHGEDSLVLLSHAEYQRLKRRDRQVMRTEDAPSSLRDAVAAAKPSAEAERFNDELN